MAEVLGSVLLVALTVAVSAGLVGILLWTQPGPSDDLRAQFELRGDAGADGWGTGDERLRLTHQGGQALPEATVHLVVMTGNTETTYRQGGTNPLDHGGETAFDDGRMVIGETWTTPAASIELGTVLSITVVNTRGDGHVVWTGQARAGNVDCGLDVSPPRVSAWTQTPEDVSATTTGDVTVTAQVIDACNNLDTTVDPTLEHRINDGSDPAWSTVSTNHQGAGLWEATIPDQDWSLHASETLEYRLTGMTDTHGNTGTSPLRSDAIELVGTETFIASFTDVVGTTTNAANAQDDDDGGAEARLEEGANGTVPGAMTTSRYDADAVVAPGAFQNGAGGFLSDDTYATATSTGAAKDLDPIRYGFEDEASSPGTIQAVTLRAEVKADDGSKSTWRLQACIASTCSTQSRDLGNPTTDTYLTYNVTDLRPGGGSWTWSDLNDLEVQVTARKTGGGTVTFSIDHVEVEVKHRPPGGTAYNLDITGEISGLPSATTHRLELGYRASVDTFQLEVWDWTNDRWTQRADLTTQGSQATELIVLTGDEVAGGQIQVRFTDTTTSTDRGALFLDYVKVISS